ncbi:unnamed protein product [Blepharisma stoltei]|uniref:Uncharacterized protein n=1 Tax=Blepharisma stoltei TaxID=1481888 RepID=A0AAU9JA86_9CILI|nr:unnamed protein product [Blepharisma stoltei]
MYRIILTPVAKYKTPGERVFCGPGARLIPNSIAKIGENSYIADLTLSVDNELLVVKAKGLLKYISKIIEAYEKELLPEERKCAQKIAYDYYEKKELVSPLKGLEEKDFEKNEAITSKLGCMEKHFLSFQSNKCESKCWCEIYDYCTKCKDENAKNKGWYCFCKDRFYMYERDNSCKACSKYCLTCTLAGRCLRCKAPNFVSDDDICKGLESLLEVVNSNDTRTANADIIEAIPESIKMNTQAYSVQISGITWAQTKILINDFIRHKPYNSHSIKRNLLLRLWKGQRKRPKARSKLNKRWVS